MQADKTHIESDEETLSLCDLPLHSDQNSTILWNQYLSLAASSSISSSSQNDDVFEFNFTQELHPPPTAAAPPENIIFCGKLIPYKNNHTRSSKLADQNKNKTKKSIWPLFISKLITSCNDEFDQGTTTPKRKKVGPTRRKYNSDKHRKYNLFLFGISRFPAEVELRDIMSRRRSRRRCPPSPPSAPFLGYQFGDDEVSGGGRKWGFWWLIKALSCG